MKRDEKIEEIKPLIPPIDKPFIHSLPGTRQGKEIAVSKAHHDFNYLNSGHMARIEFDYENLVEERTFNRHMRRAIKAQLRKTDQILPMSVVNGKSKTENVPFKRWSFEYQSAAVLSGIGTVGLLSMSAISTHMMAMNTGWQVFNDFPALSWTASILPYSATLALKFGYSLMPNDVWRKVYRLVLQVTGIACAALWANHFADTSAATSDYTGDSQGNDKDSLTLKFQILADILLSSSLYLTFSNCFARHSKEHYCANPEAEKLKEVSAEDDVAGHLEDQRLGNLIKLRQQFHAARDKHIEEVSAEFHMQHPNV